MSIGAEDIARFRRRYVWMAVSICVLDIGVSVIFRLVNGRWVDLWMSVVPSLLLLLGVNGVIASRLFEPIRRFLAGEIPFEETERRLTQLPLLTARWVAIFAFLLFAYRNSLPWWLPASDVAGLQSPTIADYIAVCLLVPIYYFTYTYFIVSDYLATLCIFIFERTGRNLTLYFGRYATKLIVALLVVSIVPLGTIIVDLFSYTGERQQAEILVDAIASVIGLATSAYYVSRSLLRPIGVLSRAMAKVAEGDLEVRAPVTSNDEIGALTGRFNTMIEGLREREQLRETFGRFVDESVAATILRRQGEGARKSGRMEGETGEATILFSDIAGFTTVAEYLTPAELIGALNDYLATVLAPIREHGGVIHTFIGDGLFASFNMPLACESHAAAAVRAALDIQRAVGSRTFGDQGISLATRIGISSGPVIGGEIGAGKRMNFTLLGDTVNLAARLEELNKHHGTRILVSQSTRDACGDTFPFEALGTVTVRGRSEAVAIFSLDPNRQEQTQ